MRYQADHLSLADPASFYNAFYPIGYPLFLRVCSWVTGSPFHSALVCQILIAGIFAYFLHKMAVLILPRTAALVAVVATLLWPGVIRAELSTVPDFFAMVPVSLAVYTLFEARPLHAGVWIGIASLFRFHAIAFAIAVGIALISIPNERRAIGRVAMGFLPFVAILLGIQLWSIGSISFGSGFNIWKTMHGVDWSNLPRHFDRSAWEVIRAEPVLFVSTWLGGLMESWYLWIPLVAFLIATLKWRMAPIVRVVAIAALLYHILTVPGGSVRGPILIAPIVVLAVVWLLATITRLPVESKFGRRLSLAAIGGFALVGVAFMLLSADSASSRIDEYRALGTTLGLHSARDLTHVYSDDYALYFPDFADANPRFSGGWPELGLPVYAREYPHLPDSTADAFYNAIKMEGIAYVVIRGRPLDARAFVIVSSDSLRYRPLRRYGYRVYRVQ